MDEPNDTSDPLDRIIDEFLEELKENRYPTLELYQSKYPQYAEQLAEFLPLVASLHQNTSTSPSCPNYWNLKPGVLLDHYEILREIGRGGMGIVYQAKQLGLDRIVALKILILHPADSPLTLSKKQARFLREAKLCSTLHHANIIPIIQHGTDQGYCFYSMQYIDGSPLSKIIAQWRQDNLEHDSDSAWRSKAHWHQIARWIHDGADAVETAHQRRILHRDIKPSNLIVDSKGKIWLGDFGLAKDISLDSSESISEGIGTVQYMSPEALVSQSTERSDIYGLGITLYELLARIPKYPKDTPVNLLRRIKDDDAPSLKQIDPGIPQDLITITQKATALLPSDRYGSAAELRDDLARFLAGQPILARSNPLGDQCRRWVRNHLALAYSLTTATVFLVFTALLATLFWIDSQRKLSTVELARKQSLIDQQIANAQRAVDLGKPGGRTQAKRILNQAKEDLKDQHSNSNLQRVITDILATREFKSTPMPQAPAVEKAVNYACDQDYRRILYCDADGITHLYSLPDWNLLHTFDSIQKHRFVSISPDGRYATIGFDERSTSSRIGQGFECWDLTTSPPNLLWKRENLSMSMGFWNASSDILYCMEFDGTILGMKPATNEILYRLEPSGPFYEAVLYPHPTLPLLAVASYYYPEIHFRELETGATLTLPFEDRVQSFSWHPSGREFATTHWRSVLRRIQWPTGQIIDTINVNQNGGELRYSPDGRWLAVSYWAHQIELLNTETFDRIVFPWVWTFFNLYWSSDSRTVAINAVDKKFCRLEIESQRGNVRTLYTPTYFEGFYQFAFDPKHQLLLANSIKSIGDLTVLDLLEGHSSIAKLDSKTDPFFVGVDQQGRFHAIDHAQSMQLIYQSRVLHHSSEDTLSLRLEKTQGIPFKATAPKMSDDGSYMFAMPTRDQIFRWPTESPDRFTRLTIPWSRFVDFSSTGKWIALMDELEGKQLLIDCQSNQKSLLVDGSDHHAFFSKNDELVFLSPSSRIYKFGQWEKPIADLPDADCNAAVFSADGKLLVRSDANSQDVAVYSLDQKKDVFHFSFKDGTPERMWLTDDNTQLILCARGSGTVAVRVVDFADLHTQASKEFPGIPYLPMDLVQASSTDSRTAQHPPRSIRHIEQVMEPADLDPISSKPLTSKEFSKFWTILSLEENAVFEDLSQVQLEKSKKNQALLEVWDNQVQSNSSAEKLNDIAEALANAQRYDEAIAACDLSLQKLKVNFDAKIIKAYSQWQNRSPAKALDTLSPIKDDFEGDPEGEFFCKTLRYQIEASMHPEKASGSHAFLRALDSWTRQHPTQFLSTLIEDSMAGSETRNLYALNLLLAEETIAQNNKIPDHWLILAQAKMQVGDTDGARQAVRVFVKLKSRNKYQLLLKLQSKSTRSE